ncbi:MAG TPA: DUF1622 domain-containing protein [Pyrinomonadaceae bacterium]|nr:DUF1622 domain-containing protein [Pyrinomonadaceae bacterium]
MFLLLAEETTRGGAESTIINAVLWLELVIETISAIIIGIGVLMTVYGLVRSLFPPSMKNYNRIRLMLARYLALALEFQLGADILSTAIAPSWDQIGKLGAIAVIRTALNFFLTREMQEERKKAQTDETTPPASLICNLTALLIFRSLHTFVLFTVCVSYFPCYYSSLLSNNTDFFSPVNY